MPAAPAPPVAPAPPMLPPAPPMLPPAPPVLPPAPPMLPPAPLPPFPADSRGEYPIRPHAPMRLAAIRAQRRFGRLTEASSAERPRRQRLRAPGPTRRANQRLPRGARECRYYL